MSAGSRFTVSITCNSRCPRGRRPSYKLATTDWIETERTRMRPFDAMIVEDSTFEKLVGSSREETVAETVVRLPSLPSLVAQKLHAL